MFTTIVIDDERKAAENLEILINEFCPDIKIVDLAHSSKEGIDKIQMHAPDLIFLDIEMPFMSGFDMLAKITLANFEVIFTTAHDEFAIQAFKVNAVDYLLKPVIIDDLKSSVSKAIDRIRLKQNNPDVLAQMIRYFEVQAKTRRIPIGNSESINYIETNQVLYLCADSNYTHVYLLNGKKLTMSKTLKDVEEHLPHDTFFRIHIGTIVNLTHISKYIRGEGGSVIMSNGINLEVAKRRKHELLERLN